MVCNRHVRSPANQARYDWLIGELRTDEYLVVPHWMWQWKVGAGPDDRVRDVWRARPAASCSETVSESGGSVRIMRLTARTTTRPRASTAEPPVHGSIATVSTAATNTIARSTRRMTSEVDGSHDSPVRSAATNRARVGVKVEDPPPGQISDTSRDAALRAVHGVTLCIGGSRRGLASPDPELLTVVASSPECRIATFRSREA